MKAPRCKLCGKEHWASEPHVFGGAAAAPAVKQKKGLKRRPLRRKRSSK